MGENQQDKTDSKPTAPEDKATPSSSSPQDQRGTDQLQNNQMEGIIKQLKDSGYKVTKEYNEPGQLSKVSGESPLRKTWWDWAQLLIVPILIAGLGIGFTWVQNQTSLQIAKENRTQDLLIAKDTQEEATLKAYLDDMSDLLLNHNLRKSKPTDDVRQVARERTLTVLRRLKADRNQIVLQFLQDAQLIVGKNTVIDLSNANLSGDDLSGTNLSAANLRDANLSSSHLNGANLSAANLSQADLSDADLSGAHLSGADLLLTYLHGVHLHGADLSGAYLSSFDSRSSDLCAAVKCPGSGTNDAPHLYPYGLAGQDLSDVDLSGADLSDADLSGTNLSFAKLSNAYLSGAKLSSAKLSNADLSGAFMMDAHLSNADLSFAHLSFAYLSNALQWHFQPEQE